MVSRSRGRRDQAVTFDSWQPDRGLEMVLGRKRKMQRPPDDESLALLLGDDD